MNYPRRHNRANTAVTHEKSKYDMTSLYRQPMVVGSSPTISSTATVVRNLPSDPFVWVGGFCYVGRSHIVLISASFDSLLALV